MVFPFLPGKFILQHLARVAQYEKACIYDGGGDGNPIHKNYWDVSAIKGKVFPVLFILQYYLLLHSCT